MERKKAERNIFVTVGTTKFEHLVQAIDTPTFCDEVIELGYTSLTIQVIGDDSVIVPEHISSFQNPHQPFLIIF
tara:strand:+ start:561 stop:782 length:222 start_codon:yes stop_codon:yes gene_type:complete